MKHLKSRSTKDKKELKENNIVNKINLNKIIGLLLEADSWNCQ